MRSPYLQSDAKRPIEAPTPIITVGPKTGMFIGGDHLAIQGAIDYAAGLGGGTVKILPGRYILRNALCLSSHITLEGVAGQTVLRKSPPQTASPLREDLDWYGWRAELNDTTGWHPGDGVLLESTMIDTGTATQYSRHTVVSVDKSGLGLDSMPRINHWTNKRAKAIQAHSLIEAQRSRSMTVKDLILEGDRENDPYLDGNIGGAIFLHDCEETLVQNVTIDGFNGDGISWQISHDVEISQCLVRNVTDLGLHPGSGSQRPIMRANTISDCQTGIYWCWGVKNGIAEANQIERCRLHGISTGHRDTDNVIRHNRIKECGEAGIFFRTERSPEHTSHRTLVEDNEISWSGTSLSAGIVLARGVRDARIRNNRVATPPQMSARGLMIDPEAVRPIVEGNCIKEQEEHP